MKNAHVNTKQYVNRRQEKAKAKKRKERKYQNGFSNDRDGKKSTPWQIRKTTERQPT